VYADVSITWSFYKTYIQALLVAPATWQTNKKLLT